MTDKLTYLALGDSYTVGEGVSREESYPFQLRAALNQIGFGVDGPVVVAKTGWTTDDLALGIHESGVSEVTFDLVTLLIGVNDQYQAARVSDFKTNFSFLLKRSVSFAGGNRRQLIVLSIPDWSVTPFASALDKVRISCEIDLFNSQAKAICESEAVRWVDVTGISRRAGKDSSLLASDGLHPSGKMYTTWVDKILPAVSRALALSKSSHAARHQPGSRNVNS